MNRAIYIIFLIVFIVALAVIFIPVALGTESMSDNLPPLVFLIVILLYFAGNIYFSYRRNKKIISLLNDQCDPDAFIAQTQRQLDKFQHRGNIPYVLLQCLNLGAGLSAAGRNQEALAAIQFDAALIKSDRFGRLMRLTYHQNHFACFISLGMLDHARQALLWLNDAIDAEKDSKLLEKLRRWYKNDYYRYEMENGRFDGTEAVFQEMLERAENNYHRVLAMYTLGLVHEHYGRPDKAREAFEYVLAHGNKLHVVTLAKQRLAAMGAV